MSHKIQFDSVEIKGTEISPGISGTIFPSGAVRGTDSSDFIADVPTSVLHAYAKAFEDGKAKGYPHGNWRKGFPYRNLISHAMVHLSRFAEGDQSEDHLSHALFNIGTLIEQEAKGRTDLDDRIPLPAIPARPPLLPLGVVSDKQADGKQTIHGLQVDILNTAE